jgi:hypothetical protein
MNAPSRRTTARPGPAELDAAERLVLAAARLAAETSTRYHYIRTLGGIARWTLMDPEARVNPPAWALRLRAWEGGFYGGGASRLAGMDCLSASRNYHLAYAHLEGMRALAATTSAEHADARARRDKHLEAFQRAGRRLGAARRGKASGSTAPTGRSAREGHHPRTRRR